MSKAPCSSAPGVTSDAVGERRIKGFVKDARAETTKRKPGAIQSNKHTNMRPCGSGEPFVLMALALAELCIGLRTVNLNLSSTTHSWMTLGK